MTRSVRRHHARRSVRGFTLLEVMAALVIFATAAIVLGAAYVNVLRGYQSAERATRVNAEVGFAREIVFRIADLERVEEGGDFEAANGRTVRWRAEVIPTEVADLFEVIFEVVVEGNQDVEEEIVTERFRMLRPTWSEDDEREKLRQESRDRITEYVREQEAQR